MAATLTFQPLSDAIAKLNARTPIGRALTSYQWSAVPLALRERALFSANVESVRLLAAMQDKLSKHLGMIQEQVGDGKMAGIDRSSFIADIRKVAEDLGVRTTDAAGAGTVRDIRSAKRLGMIFDIQTQQAAEYARWKMDQDKDILAAYPAYRLIRVEARRVPRDWQARWAAAGAKVGWSGAHRGDWVALKNSPIWPALSRFGTPWPPYDYNSGMGREDINRETAEQLGLIKPDETPEPGEVGFNAELESSVSGLDPEYVGILHTVFGDRLAERNGRLHWRGDAA